MRFSHWNGIGRARNPFPRRIIFPHRGNLTLRRLSERRPLLPKEISTALFLYGYHRWRGETRRSYRFNILLTDRNIPSKGGIYIFVRRRFIVFLQPLYVGKAANLKSRLKKHKRWGQAFWDLGATEKHICLVSMESDRQMIEEDLIRRLKPPLNTMLTPRSRNDGPNNEKLLMRWARRAYWKKKT